MSADRQVNWDFMFDPPSPKVNWHADHCRETESCEECHELGEHETNWKCFAKTCPLCRQAAYDAGYTEQEVLSWA